MGNQYYFVVNIIYTLHFYPWLKFSISFCIFTLVILLVLRKTSHTVVPQPGQFLLLSWFYDVTVYFTYGALYLSEGFNPRIEPDDRLLFFDRNYVNRGLWRGYRPRF